MYKNSIDTISDLLFIESNINTVDLIFVLGNEWVNTMYNVKKLYGKGLSKQILISGNSGDKNIKKPEAISFMEKGIELGIPKEKILLEVNSTNTKENFLYSKNIIDKYIGFSNIKSILFVCKTFHTRRVLMTAKKQFPKNIKYYFYPIIDKNNIRKNNWWKNEISINIVLRELGKIANYSLKGDLCIN